MLQHQIRKRVSGASGKRFVALWLILATFVLLGIPDETDLQPVVLAGVQSLSDGGDDVDDGDTNGKPIALPMILGVVRGSSIFARRYVGEPTEYGDRIGPGESVSPRGPPPPPASTRLAGPTYLPVCRPLDFTRISRSNLVAIKSPMRDACIATEDFRQQFSESDMNDERI